MNKFDRRKFLKNMAAGSMGLLGGSVLTQNTGFARAAFPDPSGFAGSQLPDSSGFASAMSACPSRLSRRPEIRTLTGPPGFHWFGYYDKWQMDVTGRYVLGMQVDFEHRSPEANDIVKIGLIDLLNGEKWTEIGQSRAWNWQQGCMLQWIPGSDSEVLWNDREDNRFITRVLNIKTGESRTLPLPVYSLSPDRRYAITTDFERINNQRPGYGYAGIPDPYEKKKVPPDSGIYRMDLQNGTSDLIVPYSEIVRIPHHGVPVKDHWHWFNHLLVNTDGTRFVFLHRWRQEMTSRQERAVRGWTTRMFTANMDGSDLYLLNDSGLISHFIWKDPVHINAWTRPSGKEAGFYLMQDRSENIRQVGKGVMTSDGHLTYVPNVDNEWILNDTYPDRNRNQELYLYHIPSNRRITLGFFHLPEVYRGEWRCDLHPRTSQDGTKVMIDSPWRSNGRQLYMLDIESILA